MIEFRKARPIDAAIIKPKIVFNDNPNVTSHVQDAINSNLAYTLTVDGEIFAIVGYSPIHALAGELWSLISERVEEIPVTFHRACARAMDAFVTANDLKRVQVVVKEGFTQGEKWAEALGFTKEGLMKSYGYDGSNYWIMGRTY